MRERRRPSPAPLVAAFAVMAVSPGALANGRFPNATQLVVAPSDRSRYALRATYGLIQTFDGGTTWSWLCEAAVGYRGTFDPAILVTRDNTLLAGLPDGMSATRDRGCTFTRALGPGLVLDLARSDGLDERVFAIAAGGDGGDGSLLHESTDGGRTWSLAADLADVRAETVDVAPSDPSRVYLSGVRGGRGVFLRSTDGGSTFAASEIDLAGGRAPFIAAVDPKSAGTVYVRVDGGGSVADALLVSRDGGQSFERITMPVRQLLGTALSPDGSQIAIGGPDDGILVAPSATLAFTKRSNVRVRCLTWTDDGLFACASRDADGFALGRSTDAGRTFSKFFDVPELTQLACAPPSTVAETCSEAWQAVSSMIGEDPNAFVPDAAPDSAPTTPAAPSENAGCGRCGPARGAESSHGVLLALFALWLRRRQKRAAARAASRMLR